GHRRPGRVAPRCPRGDLRWQGLLDVPLPDQLSDAAHARAEAAAAADTGVETDTGTATHTGTSRAHPDLAVGRDHAVTRPGADRAGSSREGAYRRPEAQGPPASGHRAPQAQASPLRDADPSWGEPGGPELRHGLRPVQPFSPAPHIRPDPER